MFSWRKWAIIHPLFVQNYIQRSIAFHSPLASHSTAHKIKYGIKDVCGENKSDHRSTEVEGFRELNLSYTIISFDTPSTTNQPNGHAAPLPVCVASQPRWGWYHAAIYPAPRLAARSDPAFRGSGLSLLHPWDGAAWPRTSESRLRS